MKEIKITIRKESFNDEYHADIWLDHNKARYVSSGGLRGLLEEINAVVIKEKVE